MLVITISGKSHRIPWKTTIFLWFSYRFPIIFPWVSYSFRQDAALWPSSRLVSCCNQRLALAVQVSSILAFLGGSRAVAAMAVGVLGFMVDERILHQIGQQPNFGFSRSSYALI